MKLVFLIFAFLLSNTMVWAQKNPFDEGVKRPVLTSVERESLLQYAENSRTQLEKLLEDVRGKSANAAFGLYVATIKQVVLESFKHKGAEELLTRIPLNQALFLTVGVPQADGVGLERPGILKETMARDVLTRILEDSVRLAIRYFQDDRVALTQSDFDRLPHSRFAYERLELARRWLAAIPETELKYAAQLVVLDQWFTVAFLEDKLHRALYAEELNTVLLILEDQTSSLGQNKIAMQSRVLQGVLNKLALQLRAKLVEAGELSSVRAEDSSRALVFGERKEAASKSEETSSADALRQAPSIYDPLADRHNYFDFDVGPLVAFGADSHAGFSAHAEAQLEMSNDKNTGDSWLGARAEGRADFDASTRSFDFIDARVQVEQSAREYTDEELKLPGRESKWEKKYFWQLGWPTATYAYSHNNGAGFHQNTIGVSMLRFYIKSLRKSGSCFAIEAFRANRPIGDENTLSNEFIATFPEVKFCYRANTESLGEVQFDAGMEHLWGDKGHALRFKVYLGFPRIFKSSIGVGVTGNADKVYLNDEDQERDADIRTVFGVNGRF